MILTRTRGNTVTSAWIPTQEESTISKAAKAKAKETTTAERMPPEDSQQAKSTITAITIAELQGNRVLPTDIGKFSKELNTALPGTHTCILYDGLKKKEAKVLAQLRTGMSHLNDYLYWIGAAESDQCACEQAKETVKHFLFTCWRWKTERLELWEQSSMRRGCLSFYLEGKNSGDTTSWRPDMHVVQAAIKFAILTERLDLENQELHTQLFSSSTFY